MSDDYVYLSLKNRTVISPVNPNEFHSSLRDKLVQEGNQVNRLEMVTLWL